MKHQIKKLDLSKIQTYQNGLQQSYHQQKSQKKTINQDHTCLTDRQKDMPFNKNNESAILSNIKSQDDKSIKNIIKQYKSIISPESKLSTELKNQILLGIRQHLKEQIEMCNQMSKVKKVFKLEVQLSKNKHGDAQDLLESSRKAKQMVSDYYSFYVEYANKNYQKPRPSVCATSRKNSPQKYITQDELLMNGNQSSRSKRSQRLEYIQPKPVSIFSIICSIQKDNKKMKEIIQLMKDNIKDLEQTALSFQVQIQHFKINFCEYEQILEEKCRYEDDLSQKHLISIFMKSIKQKQILFQKYQR
ncbi:hypothetical protein TTHERM_000933399 (macronuclear) [Tetrahymena thermophila SB210]|uniref:Uncharacterized protein n=1 Tax=Tetrahymena thermophila (strain SB210) TaxID=312017 RepID=W7X130_TETTS|nr:hypothetical protein TTHERM_000933399 [Tetrahymena thermophila SB210]EWS72875.1 hypothetical protein TTHERM_000933399 [Tetrahymena thermophila SB210]|eukprot:XP_012654603.1 hypothetical protein TTHERM_000933399 [Tetrahymena thermophila SB210]